MPPAVASLVFAVGICGLFWLDRDRDAKTSPGLWLPVVWLAIISSRSVSRWLGDQSALDSPNAEMYLDGSPLDRAVLGAFILLGVLVLIARRKRAVEILQQNIPVLLFMAYALISTLWADIPFVALKRWTKALGALAMVLVVLTDADPTAALKRLFTRVGFLLIPLSMLFNKYYPQLARYYDRWEGTQYYSGVTTDKNMLGCISFVFGLALLWRVVYALRDLPGRSRRILALGVALGMSLWLFHIANSATAFGCLTLGAAVIVVLHLFGRRRPMVVHALIGGVAATALVAYLFQDAFAFLVGSLGRNTTLTGRTDLWHDLLKMDTSPWFGVGFESFFVGDRVEQLWRRYWWHPNEAHNGYLETYLTLGRIGICLLVVLMVTGYRNAVSIFRRDPTGGSLRLAFLLVASLYNITEAAFKVMHPVWIVFLLAVSAVPEPVQTAQEELQPGEARDRSATDERVEKVPGKYEPAGWSPGPLRPRWAPPRALRVEQNEASRRPGGQSKSRVAG